MDGITPSLLARRSGESASYVQIAPKTILSFTWPSPAGIS